MMRFTKAVAAFAALALTVGASAVSAQSYGFTHPGELVTARGQIVENLYMPGTVETICNIEVYGAVAPDGKSMIFDAYDGVQAPGDSGNLACYGAVDFPIVVTASSANQVNLDQLFVGTRGGPCQEVNYKLAYSGNTATFSGAYFGIPAICRAAGSLTLTADSNGAAVNIVTLP
ncbi:hypothetical protein [Brevundimonas sp. TSRC1-1]|uniref:hypothetical protein n=1 Tax=Brevundimonas sp. TSRC1-1 TaxID=2804562 RepID=UPI003CF1E850